MVINSNLFNIAENAGDKTKAAYQNEQNMGNMKRVEIEDVDDLLLNPGKGFYLSTREANYTDTSCDEAFTVIYRRFNWCDIEPTEGTYNWELIDNMLADCELRGKKFAFGVMNANSSSKNVYVTPQWVFDAGAESYEAYISSSGVTQIIPVWTDEIFLSKVNNFVNALAERYDGNENIEFIEIRSYGDWGEQHLGNLGGDAITSEQLKELYITPYQNAFQSTQLINIIGKEEYCDTYNVGINDGISVRRDGIFHSYNIGKVCFDYAYSKLPTIIEYYQGYPESVKQGTWSDDALLEEIELWRPSYTEFCLQMYEDDPEFCKTVANKVGYYFRLKEAEYRETVNPNETTNINLTFTNEGVAPLYKPCTVYVGLLDENNQLIAKYKTDINPQIWMPNQKIKEKISVKFTGVEEGKYKVAVGLYLNESDENPTYLLGSQGKTDNNWYIFGEINLDSDYAEQNVTINGNEYASINEYIETLIGENCNHVWNWTVLKESTDTGERLKQGTCEICGKVETRTMKIVGAYINGYNPAVAADGSTIDTSYESIGSKTDGTLEKDGTTDGTSGNGNKNQTFTVNEITKWRIIGEDEEGRVMITTADPILKDDGYNMIFRGQAGYMNAIEELDKICSIYGQGKYADTSEFSYDLNGTTIVSGARSIRVEDIGAKIEKTTTQNKYSKKLYSEDNNYYIYMNSQKSDYTNFIYWDDNTETWNTLSEESEVLLDFYGVPSVALTGQQLDMVYNNSEGNATMYYLANKMPMLSYGVATYTICSVYNSKIGIGGVYVSDGVTEATFGAAVRPVVYLDANVQLSYDSTTGEYTIN